MNSSSSFRGSQRFTSQTQTLSLDQILLGYRAAAVLFAAAELDVFSVLRRWTTANDVASQINTTVRPTRVVLDALCALRLLDKSAGRYRLSVVGEELFGHAKHNWRRSLVYQEITWRRSWSRLADVLRTGRPAVDYERIMANEPGFAEVYADAMDFIATEPTAEIVASIDGSGLRRIIDIGSGPARLTRALLIENPAIRATVVDLPGVIAQLRDRFAGDGLDLNDVDFLAGDYKTSDFGTGYGLAILSQVCHNEPEEEVQRLFEKSFCALEPGGRLLVHDFMSGGQDVRPLYPALFAVHMLVLTHGGSVYSRREYARWLTDAGFTELQWRDVCVGRSNASVAVVATKPARCDGRR